MAVRVDEAGRYDMPGRVDDGGVGRVDPGCDLGDFRSVDEHVADGVIADALVHRENRSALDQRAATLNADAFGHDGGRGAMRGFEIDGGGHARIRFDCESREARGVRPDLRRGDLTNLAQRAPLLIPRSPRRSSRRRWRNRTESGSGRQFPGLFADGLLQAQSLKLDQLRPLAGVDQQGRRPAAAGEVERAALIAVEARRLPGIEHEANARRRA